MNLNNFKGCIDGIIIYLRFKEQIRSIDFNKAGKGKIA